jgi:hypothetical protein
MSSTATIELAKERLIVSGGNLIWREKHGNTGESRRWNARYAGKIAGSVANHGYVMIRLDGKDYLAHRVIFAIVNNRWPADMLDHVNGDILDNSIENLRECTRSQNSMNSMRAHGASKCKGVAWSAQHGKWRAYITKDKKRKHLGLYDNERDAAQAYDAAALNEFGQFARPNFHSTGIPDDDELDTIKKEGPQSA